ncbi:hypothetical protein [Streptomyces sp. NPDC002851]
MHPERPTLMRHHHGYTWLGTGFGTMRDGPRRVGHPEFSSSGVPPLELAHWLLKPAHFVMGTWTDPREAAAWFGRKAREHVDAFIDSHDRSSLDAKIIVVAEAVAYGEDVAGGWWMSGQRFLAVHLIACSPHRFRPEYVCPVPNRVPESR